MLDQLEALYRARLPEFRRVAAADAVLTSGKRVPLRVERFPKLHVTFVVQRDRLPCHVLAVLLRDVHGSIVGRERVTSY